jgi:hypothetical protein
VDVRSDSGTLYLDAAQHYIQQSKDAVRVAVLNTTDLDDPELASQLADAGSVHVGSATVPVIVGGAVTLGLISCSIVAQSSASPVYEVVLTSVDMQTVHCQHPPMADLATPVSLTFQEIEYCVTFSAPVAGPVKKSRSRKKS